LDRLATTHPELVIAADLLQDAQRRGILFAGLDVIGDYLTEVNVTSPTCARELDAQFGLNIAGMVFDAIEATGPAGPSRP
jgi:glutathione synthase